MKQKLKLKTKEDIIKASKELLQYGEHEIMLVYLAENTKGTFIKNRKDWVRRYSFMKQGNQYKYPHLIIMTPFIYDSDEAFMCYISLDEFYNRIPTELLESMNNKDLTYISMVAEHLLNDARFKKSATYKNFIINKEV